MIGDGTVDLIGNGFFDFYPGNGLYVDLDGSTWNAGLLRSTTLPLNPGTYTLEFMLGGSTRRDVNIVHVSLGSLYSESFTLESIAPLALVSRTFVVESVTSANLDFQNVGGDRLGAILDNVKLSGELAPIDELRPAAVPEPGTLMLLTAGLCAAALASGRGSRIPTE
jgi:hypothetical protein